MTARHLRSRTLLASAVVMATATSFMAVTAVSHAATRQGSVAATLHVTSDSFVPHANGTAELIGTEAADGTVFLVVRISASADSIEVAAGSRAAKDIATVPHGTVAIAASKTMFFVAGRTAISSFSRTTGAVLRTWSVRVPRPLGLASGPLVYGDGRLWAVRSTASGRKVVEIDPTSATVKTVGSGRNVFALAVGSRGVYFVRSGGHTLIRVAASGARVTAPTHEVVNEHLSGPAAVQVVAVDGSTLLVSHDAGQGLDAELVRYNAKTLARIAAVSTNVFHTAVVPTVDGNLVLLDGTIGGGCSTSARPVCVAAISTKTAKTGHGVRLPTSEALSALFGPRPAVVVRHGAHAQLIRLR